MTVPEVESYCGFSTEPRVWFLDVAVRVVAVWTTFLAAPVALSNPARNFETVVILRPCLLQNVKLPSILVTQPRSMLSKHEKVVGFSF